jgi:hypothetical protein
MRSRVPLLALLFAVGLFALPAAVHAAIPFFGPIIPNEQITVNGVVTNQNVCAAGWGMVMIVINNIISLLLTLVVVFVAPLMFAYAGFLFVLNPINSGGREKAKHALTNTIGGLVIALAGWMIVDAVMAVLYNQGAQTSGGTLGVWSSLISSNGADLCIPLAASLKQVGPTVTPGVTVIPPTANCAAAYASVLPGISVSSSGNCCDRTNGKCTSLDGMSSATISQIIHVQNKCGGVTVTGGTEVGHSGEGSGGSHSGGSKVDIGQNLISCVQGATGNSLITPPSFGSSQIKDKCGNVYTWEGNHTDIYVAQACPL